MNIAVSIVGLALLILIHEAGHFVVALAVRMRPRRFYIFFPPPLVKRVHNGIEYGIGTIPLGGYVKIPGMHRPAARDVELHFDRALEEAPWRARHRQPRKGELDAGHMVEARARIPDLRDAVARADLSDGARRSTERALTDVDDGLSPDAYWRAAVWKRVAVILAGPGTNLLFAIALLALVFMLGRQVDVKPTVAIVEDGMPAKRFLQPGDEIVAVNGRNVAPREISLNIRGGAEFFPAAFVLPREQVTVTFIRDESRRTFTVPPVRTDTGYRLGFALEPVYERDNPGEAIVRAAEQTWLVTKAIFVALGRIVTGDGRDEVASPVGIVQVSSETLDIGFRDYLAVLALISLSLALLNMLPLLPLDGGHIAFSLAEGVRGRAVPREAYERVSAIGIALVLLLFFIGLSNDIDRIRGG